jgi:hypothetical protein
MPFLGQCGSRISFRLFAKRPTPPSRTASRSAASVARQASLLAPQRGSFPSEPGSSRHGRSKPTRPYTTHLTRPDVRVAGDQAEPIHGGGRLQRAQEVPNIGRPPSGSRRSATRTRVPPHQTRRSAEPQIERRHSELEQQQPWADQQEPNSLTSPRVPRTGPPVHLTQIVGHSRRSANASFRRR